MNEDLEKVLADAYILNHIVIRTTAVVQDLQEMILRVIQELEDIKQRAMGVQYIP